MTHPVQELAALDRMLAHFSEKKKQYTEYHRVCEQVYYYGPGASRVTFYIAGLLLSVITLVTVGCMIAGEFGTGLLVFGLLGLLPGSLLVGGGLLVHRKNRKNYRKCCDRYLALTQELMAHYEAFGPCPLGPEYTDPQTLTAIRGCLESGRAATVSESASLALSKVSANALDSHVSRLNQYTSHLPALPVFYPGRFFSADPREVRDFLKHVL